MTKRPEPARLLISAGALLLWAAAAFAQSSTPAAPATLDARENGVLVPVPDPTLSGEIKSGTPQQPNIMVLQRLDGGDSGEPAMQFDAQRAQLREQLADPKQRAAIVKERLLQQRASNPDLARVLRIDAGTEAQLLALLVDQALANELRDGPLSTTYTGSFTDVLQQEAEDYNQQIGEITKLLGPQRVDAYLDYDRTRTARNRVEDFAAALADPYRLTNEQKDALVALFTAEEARQIRGSWLGMGAGRILRDMSSTQRSVDAIQRRSLLLQIYIDEQMIRQTETADREMLERLPQVLSPEQTRAFGARQARQLAELRARTDVLRRDAGVGANELLAPEESPPLNANLRLQINLNVNGTASNRTVTTRGTAVGFAGPEGLWVEVEPTLLDAENLSVELRFYESARGGRRLVGRIGTRPTLANAPSPTAQSADGPLASVRAAGGFRGFKSTRSVLHGRKAFLLELGVTASYL